ncbi:MAG TPA: peptidoglycan DD-metalloendopeptidase family protein [Candidatus Binatia bacterium]|nr:peptidoglycan DD-metalloendopeptidase family protein [Candidatus Binatia bacterium]
MKRVLRAIAWAGATAIAAAGCTEAVRWTDRPAAHGAESRSDAPPPEGHYVVKPGDTLYSIAFRNQLDYRELAVWNDVGPDYMIRPQQVLRLSPPPASEEGAIRTAPLPQAPQPGALPVPAGPEVVAARPTAPPPPAALPPPIGASEPVLPAGPVGWRWPVAGSVVKGFGAGSSKGIDIAGALGQPVLAAAPGKVVYSGSALRGYGELVIVKHDEVHLSAYGYNRRRLVTEGDAVTAGQPIAELGVGPEQRPVLHFEIREKGKPVDPLSLLPSRG